MGMSSLAVVFNIIMQIYDIDFKTQNLYQEKRNLAKWSQVIGQQQARSARLQPRQFDRVRLIDWTGDRPAFSTQHYINRSGPPGPNGQPTWMLDTQVIGGAVNTGGGPVVRESVRNPHFSPNNPNSGPEWIWKDIPTAGVNPVVVKTFNPNFNPDAVDPNNPNTWQYIDAPAGTLGRDANGNVLNPGEVFMTKEEQEALFSSYLKELKFREEEIDMELERLKAQRQALVSQREEFTKYISEGIKTTFKNNYA
jgi:hypothetical protein